MEDEYLLQLPANTKLVILPLILPSTLTVEAKKCPADVADLDFKDFVEVVYKLNDNVGDVTKLSDGELRKVLDRSGFRSGPDEISNWRLLSRLLPGVCKNADEWKIYVDRIPQLPSLIKKIAASFP